MRQEIQMEDVRQKEYQRRIDSLNSRISALEEINKMLTLDASK
ncbi:hypothetical protein [Pseudoalteromonas xiamenensis]